MKILHVALILAVMSSQAVAQSYNPYGSGYGSSYGNDLPSQWEQQQRRNAENSRYEDLRTQNYQQNLRLQQLEQQGRTDRRENDWQSRQLEAEQYKSGWR